MDQDTKNNLSNRNIWARILYMVLFAIAYNLAEAILVFVALFQIVAVLFTGHTNAALQRFWANLSAYAYQIFQFLTFNSEYLAFPFNDWPDAEVGVTPYDDNGETTPATTSTENSSHAVEAAAEEAAPQAADDEGSGSNDEADKPTS